ncbi:N,N-dimethylformamidase beta subunit family domain-containing protein [Tundrisphaera lichenicola]|uniref:N,N-dimethylformamidase beta subunit family domain-containing protein n=1 Tax=Tundrisphaera lichenicola TaxID=2029860 RepID=UPI003EBB5029
MNDHPSNSPFEPISDGRRRTFLAGMAVAAGSAFLPGSVGTRSAKASVEEASPGLIRSENLKPGSTDWQLTRVRADANLYRTPWIEGYCSKQSVRAGESLDIMISTDPARRFQIEIFRMGYYGGKGARLVATLGPFDGQAQPTPAPGLKDLHECHWKATTSLIIPDDWPSGVYLGRLTTLPTPDEGPYWQSYVVFIVRDERPADILFQCSDNTWQAYNRWPSHYSVYSHPKGTQGPWADVSFDRPYGREAQFDSVVNDPLTFGSGEFLPLEFPLAYWLEREGYDVTYCTNSDMLTPDRGLRCKAFVSVGHDEYLDIRQFRSVERMRDEGVSLLFLSGNSVCWVTPFQPSSDGRSNRIMFRGGPYGADRDYANRREREHGPFPEHGPDEGFLMGVRNVEPVNGGGDWIVVKPDHWIFEGTGVKAGDRIPGLIGWEYQGDPAEIPGLEVVGAGTAWVSGVTPQQWTSTIYPGPKGNIVFNASTIFWSQGLSSPPGHVLPWSHWSRPHGPDERVQRITHNLLERAIGRPRSS